MQISSVVGALAAFVLRTEPGTDIWKKPHSTDVFTGEETLLLKMTNPYINGS
jgi:hypothetical protein